MVHLKLQRMQDSAILHIYGFFLVSSWYNISGILPYKIPKYNITNANYFDWQSKILWLRNVEMSLSNILMIGLFHSNNRLVNFSKTEKKIISQQECNRPYIYDVHMERGCLHGDKAGEGGRVLKICGHKIGHFCECHE